MSVLIPKGTAAAVLAALPIQLGLAGGVLIQDVICEVILFSAVLIFFIEKTTVGELFNWFFRGFAVEKKSVKAEAATSRKKNSKK